MTFLVVLRTVGLPHFRLHAHRLLECGLRKLARDRTIESLLAAEQLLWVLVRGSLCSHEAPKVVRELEFRRKLNILSLKRVLNLLDFHNWILNDFIITYRWHPGLAAH